MNHSLLIFLDLAAKLGIGPRDEKYLKDISLPVTRSPISYETLNGFRFCLSCYVMFMHIGSNNSWGAFNNLRGFPWHVHTFFSLGGFSMASSMHPNISHKLRYFLARFKDMYPMYALAVTFGLLNLLVVCRPSTFRYGDFHWDSQPSDLELDNGETAPLFCEGTPASPNSYWLSLTSTVIVYCLGLAVFPFWYFNWWLGYYLWFSSMYFQCLAIFPAVYNYIFNRFRSNTKSLVRYLAALLLLNYAIVLVPWFLTKHVEGYNHYNKGTGLPNPLTEYNPEASLHNQAILSFYLFGPFWMLYFVIGMISAFLYHAYRPSEKHNFKIWGMIVDFCTVVMVAFSILQLSQGKAPSVRNISNLVRSTESEVSFDSSSHNIFVDSFIDEATTKAKNNITDWLPSTPFAISTRNESAVSVLMTISNNSTDYASGQFMRPKEADSYLDNAQTNRLWDCIYARFFCPITTLWIFSLATGEGQTSKLLRSKFLLQHLAPHSYNCFLFHQMVAQWYLAITRNGHWWNWWRYRKEMYWFSPSPCPVEWYEYFLVVGLVVGFSAFVTNILWPAIVTVWDAWKDGLLSFRRSGNESHARKSDDLNIETIVCESIEKITGIEASTSSLELSLGEVGLGSIGAPVLAAMITKELSSRTSYNVSVMASDLVQAETVGDIVKVVKDAQAFVQSDGL